MKDGFIQQADTPITLFEDPCNLFVATFLGSPQMNIIDAELFMDGKELKAKLNGLDNMVVTFPEVKAKQLANKKYIGQHVLLGIRPEHVRPNHGDLDAFIEVVEHLGDESILYCKMENRKDPFIIKIPFNSKIHANVDVKVEFDMNHVYLFDADTHKAIMGIPHEDEIPVRINNNILSMGKQDFALEQDFVKHLLDDAFDKDVNLAIKPEYISLVNPEEGEENKALKVRAKVEFMEQKTDYQAVYFSLEGVDGYFAFKMANDEKAPLGKEVDLYLPYQRIKVYDQDHNKVNSREYVHRNEGIANVTTKNGITRINVGGTSLVYKDLGYHDGQYQITFKQDKLLPIYSRKMMKANPELKQPVMDTNSRIKVSAYDEDVLGDKLLVYVQVAGFDIYSSFVVDNKFSVYKMPKFEMYVPKDAFTLKPIK